MNHTDRRIRPSQPWLGAALVLAAAACADRYPTAPQVEHTLPARALVRVECTATPALRTVACGAPADADQTVYGGQGRYVRLTSSSIVVTDLPDPAAKDTFAFDVTVQNLLNEAIGTPDGVVLDTAGVQVFFANGITRTGGTGSIAVANADDVKTFASGSEPRPFFRYSGILVKDQVSGAKTWKLAYDQGVTSFTFGLLVAAEVQPLLVINEVLANPGGSITDASGEWVEVYNAGTLPVNMQNLLIADSATTRRPYHVIASSLVVPSGGT